jgi:hypothetical protein
LRARESVAENVGVLRGREVTALISTSNLRMVTNLVFITQREAIITRHFCKSKAKHVLGSIFDVLASQSLDTMSTDPGARGLTTVFLRAALALCSLLLQRTYHLLVCNEKTAILNNPCILSFRGSKSRITLFACPERADFELLRADFRGDIYEFHRSPYLVSPFSPGPSVHT